jgi:hypothetical protein
MLQTSSKKKPMFKVNFLDGRPVVFNKNEEKQQKETASKVLEIHVGGENKITPTNEVGGKTVSSTVCLKNNTRPIPFNK